MSDTKNEMLREPFFTFVTHRKKALTFTILPVTCADYIAIGEQVYVIVIVSFNQFFAAQAAAVRHGNIHIFGFSGLERR